MVQNPKSERQGSAADRSDPQSQSSLFPETGLTTADFVQIAEAGFGEPENAYCHAMGYFRDHLYVGTTRHSMALLRLFPPLEPPALDPWPVQVPDRVQDLDMR